MSCLPPSTQAAVPSLAQLLREVHTHAVGGEDKRPVRCDAIKRIAQYAEKMDAENKLMRQSIHRIVLRAIADDFDQRVLFIALGRMHVDVAWQREAATHLEFTDRCYAQSGWIDLMDKVLLTCTPDQSAAGRVASRTLFECHVTSTIKELLGPITALDAPAMLAKRRKHIEWYLAQLRRAGSGHTHPCVASWCVHDSLSSRLKVLESPGLAPAAIPLAGLPLVLTGFVAALSRVSCSVFVPTKLVETNGFRFPDDFQCLSHDDAEIDMQKSLM